MNDVKLSATDSRLLESQISLEQIRLLYGGLKFSLPSSFVVAVIMYFMLVDHSDSTYLLNVWASLILTVFVIRSVIAFRFLHSPADVQQLQKWRTQFLAGTLLGGISWGLLAWLGYSSKVEYQAIIVMCVVGVCAGSLSSLSFSWKALVLFIAPATILLNINLILSEGEFATLTSFILAFFILFTLLSGKRIYDNTHQNIRLRIETDNREIALEVMHQKQLLHTKQTPLAVIEFDLELHITDWNKSAENIFGYSKSDAIGQNILKLIVPEKSLKQVEAIWKTVLNLQPIIGEAIENQTSIGKSIICEWYITPLTNRNNRIIGIAAMALDITEKKQFEEQLVNAKNESERANKAKSNFLSSMSHELRTPLNAILGFTQLLEVETPLDEKQKSHVHEINGAGQLLLQLVNQILDLARIEEGHLNLSIEQVSIDDVINECKTLISPLAEQNNISIEISETDGAYVNADYMRIKQILLNLLSNAIKYNHDGGHVRISCIQKPDNILRINVIDSGKGIPQELQKDIFSPFNRLDAASTIEGTGIGLSICKQLIEKMDGTIGVYCTDEPGSTFWVELESCSSTVTRKEKRKTGSNRKQLNNKRPATISTRKILVAEDNPINQKLILSQLSNLGYAVDMVSNGNEALKKLDESRYDILFTDCNMPVMDGYELARSIRKNGDSKLSIIAITADAFLEKEQECLAAGMDGRITKPTSLETLNNVINEQLR